MKIRYCIIKTVHRKIRKQTLKIAESLSKGFARFDYILNEEGLFFIEVNIVPGMSEASIMPKQAAEMGIPLSKLFGMTLENLF